MKNTVNDLWRMIWEFKSKTLVMVCNMEEEGSESAFIYWPFKEGEMIKYGKINVTLQSKAAYGEFTVRKFMVHEERVSVGTSINNTHTNTHTWAHTHTYTHPHTQTHTHTHTHTHMGTHTHIHTPTHTDTHGLTDSHTHTHTQAHF